MSIAERREINWSAHASVVALISNVVWLRRKQIEESGGNNWSAFSSEEIAIKSPHFPPQSNDSRLILDLWRYHPTRALISPRESRANLRRPSHLAIMKPSRTGAPPRHLAHHTEQPSPPVTLNWSRVAGRRSPPGRGSAAPVRPDDRTFCWRMGPILETSSSSSPAQPTVGNLLVNDTGEKHPGDAW
ncbi:hypothetical protein Bbelb_006320 [Branchiostoma belcheri]|nr:hypothetical protein Bbelb_006320 [Branchiostoma belcheri]